MVKYETREFQFHKQKLSLCCSPSYFMPNTTSKKFSRAVDGDLEGCVFDIGTGIGGLAVYAALNGASEVHAVDIVEEHIDMARLNIKIHKVEDKVSVYHGSLFEPLEGKKADVIIGDVSGIADAAGRALGWYKDDVPVGGYDGTEVIIEMIKQAPKFLTEKGRLYFPVAIDLSDSKKIMSVAHSTFSSVEDALPSEAEFPLTPNDIYALIEAYEGKLPHFINPRQKGKRFIWRGQIYKASDPK